MQSWLRGVKNRGQASLHMDMEHGVPFSLAKRVSLKAMGVE